jgi:hypothetical protein
LADYASATTVQVQKPFGHHLHDFRQFLGIAFDNLNVACGPGPTSQLDELNDWFGMADVRSATVDQSGLAEHPHLPWRPERVDWNRSGVLHQRRS